MPSEDLELRVSALERKIDDERRKTDSAVEHLHQQLRQLKREIQTMNLRLANTAQRR
jgi:predicted  nucleic acid-binding Zn-ribbon protein